MALRGVGVETSNDQYFEIRKLPILKITRGSIIRFFLFTKLFLIFFQIIWTQISFFSRILTLQFFTTFQIWYFLNFQFFF